MCSYCKQEIDLNNQIHLLNHELNAVTADGGANDRAIIDALARATNKLTQLEETAVSDPAACELWRVST